MKQISLVIALIIGMALNCVSANPVDKSPNPSFVLSVRVSNIPADGSKTMVVNECDIVTHTRHIEEFDEDGKFFVKVPINFGHTFTVNYKGSFINAYAEPGDSIHLEIDASKFPVSFKFSGSNESLNEEYSHAFEKLAAEYRNINLPADTVAAAEYLPAFRSEVNRIQKAVDEYIEENNISDAVAGMLRIDNIFIIANYAYGYRGKNKKDIISFFSDPIFDLGNEENTKQMYFPYHLSAFIHKAPEYVDQLPFGLTRDIASLIRAEDEETVPDRSDFFNKAYYDRVFSVQDSILDVGNINLSDIVVYDGLSVFSVSDVDPIEWVRQRFNSKPVYLDISATWCGPCRASLASSEPIREHFQDSDIEFVVVWLRSDMETWKKLVPSIKNATHIFVSDEDATNQLMGKLDMGGFPSYYLINREGQIVSGIPDYNSPALPDFLKNHED